MENRQLARLLGALSFEERLMIIGGLISAGTEGLNDRELADITGMSPSTVYIHVDYMNEAGLISSRATNAGKIHTANLDILEDLFTFLNENYGAGLKEVQRNRDLKLILAN